MDRRWYETFFGEPALDIWQNSRTDELTVTEIDYLDAVLQVDDGGTLLDLACGNGRHAVGLAQRGYAVRGIDIAEGNRARVEGRAVAGGVELQFEVGNIAAGALAPSNSVDAAYIWGNSFGYFEPAATRTFLSSVADALKPDGRFVIDTAMAAESILAELDRRSWFRIDSDTRVLLESRYSVRESRLDTAYTTIRGDRVVDESVAHVWIFTCRELLVMADAAGFDALDLHGDLEGAKYQLGDDRLILILQKRFS